MCLALQAAEIVAGMQKNLQEPDDAGLMDLYTRSNRPSR